MNTTEANKIIPTEIYERVSAIYATHFEFNLKLHDYKGDRISGIEVTRTYDLGRDPIEIVQVSDTEYVVIDQPRNFKDYFAQGGSNAYGRVDCSIAIKMRSFYHCHRVLVINGEMFIETGVWSGGRLNKDAEKSQKQLAKFVKSLTNRKSPLPVLASVKI
jgi:hypothetical protein